jgi:hypothetical protein
VVSKVAWPLQIRRPMSVRPRIAVASPLAAECTFLADWLTAEGFEPFRLSSHVRLAEELRARAFDLLVVDAGLTAVAINAVRARNPQIPIVVLGPADAAAEAQAIGRGAVYLTRPADRTLFICTISMAIMESRPERRSERKRARLDVVVQGVLSRVVDVSREGLRVEIPRTKNTAPPPPVFDVKVPMLGVSLNVRRLWTAAPPQAFGAVWYGGELSQNSRRAELAWLTLVEALPGSSASLKVQ